jgi:ribonucleoside-triphosphate reductase
LEDGMYLFTTKRCPNCQIAEIMMKELPYVSVDAEENPDLAMEYGVMQAPTLLIMHNGKAERCANVSNIKSYLTDNVFVQK